MPVLPSLSVASRIRQLFLSGLTPLPFARLSFSAPAYVSFRTRWHFPPLFSPFHFEAVFLFWYSLPKRCGLLFFLSPRYKPHSQGVLDAGRSRFFPFFFSFHVFPFSPLGLDGWTRCSFSSSEKITRKKAPPSAITPASSPPFFSPFFRLPPSRAFDGR